MAGSAVFAEIIEGDVYKYYSDGEWKKSTSGKSVPIINPTTRKTHFKVQGNPIIPPLQQATTHFLSHLEFQGFLFFFFI